MLCFDGYVSNMFVLNKWVGQDRVVRPEPGIRRRRGESLPQKDNLRTSRQFDRLHGLDELFEVLLGHVEWTAVIDRCRDVSDFD